MAPLPRMFTTNAKTGSMTLASSPAARRGRKRPTPDRTLPGAAVSADAGREQGRRRPCGTSPDSRRGGDIASPHPRGRDASMAHEPLHVGIDVSKARLDVHLSPSGERLAFDND